MSFIEKLKIVWASFFLKKRPEKTLQQERIETIEKAQNSLMELVRIIPNVPNYFVREDLYKITKTANKGLENLIKNPKDIQRASKFLNYYLVVVPVIVEKYIKLAKLRRRQGEIEETMKRIEEVLSKLNETFEKQVEKMFSDDMFDIKTEIDLLERFMKMEDL